MRESLRYPPFLANGSSLQNLSAAARSGSSSSSAVPMLSAPSAERIGPRKMKLSPCDAKAKTDKKKANLLARKEVIEELQGSRSQMVHLFDELVRTIPEGVRLSSIKQAGQTLTLEGYAQSNARVSSYMRNLEASGWMTNPDLKVIEAKGGDKGLPNMFSLKVTLKNPNSSDEEIEAAAAEAQPAGGGK